MGVYDFPILNFLKSFFYLLVARVYDYNDMNPENAALTNISLKVAVERYEK